MKRILSWGGLTVLILGLAVLTGMVGAEPSINEQTSNLQVLGYVILDQGETISNLTDDFVEFQGEGGSDNTDLRIDLDGTYPILNSPTDTKIGVSEGLVMTPMALPGSPVTGEFCVDSGDANTAKYYNGAGWVSITAAGAVSLDGAYNVGSAVDVDTDAVTLTVSDTDNNRALICAQNDTTNNPDAVQITNAGTGISLDIDGQAAARDVEGTGASWYVTGAGAGTFSSLSSGTIAGTTISPSVALALPNGQTLTGDTNGQIDFNESSETLSLVFGSNLLTLASATGIDTLAMGAIDDLTGVGTIAFDAAAASMSLAADSAADDLTISVTGAQNSSLVLSSEGTAADAFQIVTTAGGIDITNGGAAAGEDLDLASPNASINLTAAEAVADAITITASANGGGVDIAAQNDIDLTLTNGAAGEDITLSNTGGSVVLTASEAVTNAIDIDSTAGGIAITAYDTLQIDAGGAGVTDDMILQITSASAGEDLTIAQVGAVDASVLVQAAGTGTDAISLQASAGGIDIDANAQPLSLTVTSTGAADDLVLAQVGANDSSVLVQAAGTGTDAISLQASAGGIDVDAVDDLNIAVASTNAADDLVIAQTGAVDSSILLQAAGTGADAIGLTASAGGVSISGASGITMTGAVTIETSISATGDETIRGFLRVVVNDADGDTMDDDDVGTIQTNSGAVGAGVWNLPEASTMIGGCIGFVTMAAQSFDLNPDNADQILGLTDAAGDAIRNATVGNSITLCAMDATNWVALGSAYGTWSDVN